MSQGSVATRLMRGKIFSEQFIAEFAKKKQLRKSVNIWWNYHKNLVDCYFTYSIC